VGSRCLSLLQKASPCSQPITTKLRTFSDELSQSSHSPGHVILSPPALDSVPNCTRPSSARLSKSLGVHGPGLVAGLWIPDTLSRLLCVLETPASVSYIVGCAPPPHRGVSVLPWSPTPQPFRVNTVQRSPQLCHTPMAGQNTDPHTTRPVLLHQSGERERWWLQTNRILLSGLSHLPPRKRHLSTYLQESLPLASATPFTCCFTSQFQSFHTIFSLSDWEEAQNCTGFLSDRGSSPTPKSRSYVQATRTAFNLFYFLLILLHLFLIL